MLRFLSIFVFLLVFFSCTKDKLEAPIVYPALMEIPQGFPIVEFPEDNAFTTLRWQLGKKLFYDPILSVDSTVSCASCHKQELAFSDDLDFSPGVKDRPGTRNAPTLANVAYHPYFTREGGVPTLEMQILVPIQEHNEFDFNILLIAERLNQDAHYADMSQKAYNRAPDAFVITRSLANFERSLLSGNSAFDRFEYQGETGAMNAAQRNGMELFFSDRTNCSTCHNGFNFSNYAFENNGLYKHYPDPGRFRLTNVEADSALFKVPGLRNIELTGPYMHDGSLLSLEEVIEHYNSGGKDHFNKSEKIKPLNLSNQEKNELLAFLKALTDDYFISNPIFAE